MPLRVHCPNSCLIRMPTNRAGRIVRCPQCMSPIRIPEIPESELASGKPIPCHAKIVRPRESDQVESANEIVSDVSSSELESIGQSQHDPSQSDVSSDGLAQHSRLPVPEVLKPVARTSSVFVSPPSSCESDPQDQPGASEHGPSDTAKPLTEPKSESSIDPVSDQPAIAANSENSGPDEMATLASPIIDLESNAESPEDWIDGEGIPIIVREADRAKKNPSKRAKSNSASSAGKPEPVESGAADRGAAKPVVSQSAGKGTQAPEASFKPATDAGLTEQAKSESANPKNATFPEQDPSDGTTLSQGQGPQPPIAKQRAIDRVKLPKPESKTPIVREGTATPSLEPRLDFLPSVAPLLIDWGTGAGEFARPLSDKDWQDRLEKANSDRKVLARFFALCLCIVSFVNMGPAIYFWYQWTHLVESMPLPRWIYLLIFIGAIHFVYAIFLAQIPDWSAMRAVSIAMLAIAFCFGIVSTGLLVGGGQGNLTDFLGIPYTLNRQACIWCVAMLCLATLVSYWGGKESTNWQRAEHLLGEILSTSTGQA